RGERARAAARVRGRELRPRLRVVGLHTPDGRPPARLARRRPTSAADRRLPPADDARPLVPPAPREARARAVRGRRTGGALGRRARHQPLQRVPPGELPARDVRPRLRVSRAGAGGSTREPNAGPRAAEKGVTCTSIASPAGWSCTICSSPTPGTS